MSTENDRILNLIATGDTLQTRQQLQQAAQPDDRMALNRALYAPDGEPDGDRIREADQLAREALRTEDGAGLDTTLYNLGCLALAQDDIVEARMRFAEVLERSPEHLMARHNLAYAHELLAETDDARREYDSVLAQNSGCNLTRLNLAQLRLQVGDDASSLTDMDALHSRNPANMGVLLYLVRGLLQRGQPEDLDRALELLEQTPDALNFRELQECRAYTLLAQEDWDEARQAFSDLLDGDPDSAFAITGMLKILAELGEFGALRPYAVRLSELQPSEHVTELLNDLTSD